VKVGKSVVDDGVAVLVFAALETMKEGGLQDGELRCRGGGFPEVVAQMLRCVAPDVL
jgi:hypothetical protein